jgi:hypothetical protein
MVDPDDDFSLEQDSFQAAQVKAVNMCASCIDDLAATSSVDMTTGSMKLRSLQMDALEQTAAAKQEYEGGTKGYLWHKDFKPDGDICVHFSQTFEKTDRDVLEGCMESLLRAILCMPCRADPC